jgi:Ca2+:H+ antiporter
VIIPLTTITFVLPSVTSSTPDGTLTTAQSIPIAIFTLVLYVVFLVLQTGRHRGFFEGADTPHPEHVAQPGEIGRHTVLLVVTILPIVLLSKSLGKILDHEIDVISAPLALSGVLIALVVFTPEGVSALRAAYTNQLQRTVNPRRVPVDARAHAARGGRHRADHRQDRGPRARSPPAWCWSA